VLVCAVSASLDRPLTSFRRRVSAWPCTSLQHEQSCFVVASRTSSEWLTTDVTAEANITFVDNDFIRWDMVTLFSQPADGAHR